MFFDVNGIRWTLAAIGAVVILCVLDLKCSFARDRQEAGTVAHVREEMSAGRKERRTQQRDALNDQIRDLRVIVRRLVKEGKSRQARQAMATIQELEQARDRLEKEIASP